MTARDAAVSYDQSLPQVMQFFGQALLKRVNTCLPARVIRYNAATRRADIQPALDLVLATGASAPRAPIINVPVLWPGSSRWVIHANLGPGDWVLAVFAPRDISGWKANRRTGPPPTGSGLRRGRRRGPACAPARRRKRR